MTEALTGFFLGRRKYAPTFELMTGLFEARKQNQIGDVVLLLEHTPVITLGRGAQAKHILAGQDQLRTLGVEVVSTGRGGDVTLHAPGQLVAYPIIDLKPDRCDVRKYVQTLSAVMNELIRPYGLDGGNIKVLIGLWLDRSQVDFYPGEDRIRAPIKIGAIGVRISRWVTSHGFALNLSTNMDLFSLIVPCGIEQFGVTSVQQLTGGSPELRESARSALFHLNLRLGQDEPHWVDVERIAMEHVEARIYEYFSALSETRKV